MKKIELTGAVGDEIELVYGEDKLVVRLGEHRIIPDLADATIKAMKADANAFLTAAQLMYRGDAIGESNAKAKVASVVKKMFDAIPVPKPKVEPPKIEKNVAEDFKKVETKPSAKAEETPKAKVEEPKAKAETPKTETKPATTTAPKKAAASATATTKKTSSTSTAKKTTTTTTSTVNKRKSA